MAFKRPDATQHILDLEEPGQEEENGESSTVQSKEQEDRIRDWIDQDNAENISPSATLYRYPDFKNNKRLKNQVNYFRDLIPSKHELGLEYGSGDYFLVLQIPAGKKQPARCTSYNFHLDKSYDLLKQKHDQEEAAKLFQAPPGSGIVPVHHNGGGESLKEAIALVQAMNAPFMALLAPIVNKALTYQAAPALDRKSVV